MVDKRKYQRIPKSAIVRFRLAGSHLGMSSKSEDVSEEGMRLLAVQRLEPGMNLDLNFQLDDYSEAISAKGRVVWYSDRDNVYYPFTVGLRFYKIDTGNRKRIRDYISKLSSMKDSFNAPEIIHQ